MQATVIETRQNGMVYARVRRASRAEALDLSENERRELRLTPGERIEVKRQTNNPFLVYVGRVS